MLSPKYFATTVLFKIFHEVFSFAVIIKHSGIFCPLNLIDVVPLQIHLLPFLLKFRIAKAHLFKSEITNKFW